MNISLSSILLFALVIPFIMTYRLSDGDTPFWLFGIIFLSLLLYLILDIVRLNRNFYYKLKYFLLWFIVVIVIGSAFYAAIVVRHRTAPVYMIHDITLQQERAIRFFLDGTNPYATTYFGTPLEAWHYSDTEVNPALYHFVMQPFYLLFSLPFYFVSMSVFGFFDGRITLYVLFFALLVLAFLLVKEREKRVMFVTLLAFNPAMLPYTLEGRSDVFMFAFLFAGLYLLHSNKYFLAGVPIALAFAVKQSVWPILPLYIAFLLFQTKSLGKTAQALFLFGIVFLAIIVPFLFWDPKAFIDSTVFYLSGYSSHSYPISGYGFGMLLAETRFIKDLKSYYPFIIWQIGIGLPLLFFLFRYLKREPSVKRLTIAYGIFLFVFWYFSRYFNNSHLGYLSMVFIAAYFWPEHNIT